MINIYNYFKHVDSIYISEKTKKIEKLDILVVKVNKNSRKIDIRNFFSKILNFKVKKINTLIIKSKIIKYKNKIGKTKSWKKAYIFLERNTYSQHLSKLNEINIKELK